MADGGKNQSGSESTNTLEALTSGAASGSGGSGGSAVASSKGAPPEVSLENAVAILLEKLRHWWSAAVEMLPNLVVAIVVLALAFGVGAMVSRLMQRVLRRAFQSQAIVALLTTLAKVLIIVTGAFVALDLLGLQKAVVSLLAGAGIIGLALGFAFQDLAENLLAGLMLGVRKPFLPGHLIRSNDQFGFVDRLNLRNTILRNFSGQIIYIPNKEIFKNVLENYSQSGERRIEIEVGISYGDDLKKATEVLKDALEGLEFRKEDQPVQVFARSLSDYAIVFSARVWIDYPNGPIGYFDAAHRAILAIKEAVDANGLTIPFPIRTLDFNAKGGAFLKEMLPSSRGQEKSSSEEPSNEDSAERGDDESTQES
jgi:small-conductance mechanosensitive channel